MSPFFYRLKLQLTILHHAVSNTKVDNLQSRIQTCIVIKKSSLGDISHRTEVSANEMNCQNWLWKEGIQNKYFNWIRTND